MRDIQDLRNQRRESLRGLVDAVEVVPLFAGSKLQMEKRIGVTANERQRRPQLMTDGCDESFPQLLQCTNGRDVAQDRRSSKATDGLAGRA